uniref:Uncharacterized protein n=1 Tax=Timema monikensis TaxID=170555 RepID=A0A7R9DZW3_9NEOP|nr:unnamed protein product [Timema monikensis]
MQIENKLTLALEQRQGLAVGVGFGAIGSSASATFENARRNKQDHAQVQQCQCHEMKQESWKLRYRLFLLLTMKRQTLLTLSSFHCVCDIWLKMLCSQQKISSCLFQCITSLAQV